MLGLQCAEGTLLGVDLKIGIREAAKNFAQPVQMVLKASLGDDETVVDADVDVGHVGEKSGHLFLVDVGTCGAAHAAALVAIFTPWKDDGAETLCFFVKRSRPESHVDVDCGAAGEAFERAHGLGHVGQGAGVADQALVEAAEVGDKPDLTILFGHSKGRTGPFAFVGFAQDAKLHKAVHFVTQKLFMSLGNRVSAGVARFGVGAESERDRLAGEESKFPFKEVRVVSKKCAQELLLMVLEVCWDGTADVCFLVLGGGESVLFFEVAFGFLNHCGVKEISKAFARPESFLFHVDVLFFKGDGRNVGGVKYVQFEIAHEITPNDDVAGWVLVCTVDLEVVAEMASGSEFSELEPELGDILGLVGASLGAPGDWSSWVGDDLLLEIAWQGVGNDDGAAGT